MDRPHSSWGYGLARFEVEDNHPHKPMLFCRAPKGVRRRLGVKALPVFANILTMLYKKFARLIGWILSTIDPIFRSL